MAAASLAEVGYSGAVGKTIGAVSGSIASLVTRLFPGVPITYLEITSYVWDGTSRSQVYGGQEAEAWDGSGRSRVYNGQEAEVWSGAVRARE